MLKANSIKVLDIIAKQSTQNASQAYSQIHENANSVTARTNAYKLLKKPEAIIYLQRHTDKAIKTMVELLDDEKSDIRLRSSQDVLNRTFGTPVQQINTTSQQVVISIDLTSDNLPDEESV